MDNLQGSLEKQDIPFQENFWIVGKKILLMKTFNRN